MYHFFSIIIPVYNVSPYLRECLDSVLAQTFTDWEAICVDDGSTDGSGAILDEYAAKDARFKVIHQKNAGVSAARNVALGVVSGEWLTFLDADDILPQDTYSKYSALIEQYDYDAYFMQLPKDFTENPMNMCEGDGSVLYEATPDSNARSVCGADLLLQEFRLLGYPVIRLLRFNMFKSMRFPVGVEMMEDNFSLYDNLAVKAKFAVVNLVSYCYRRRKNSASNSFPVGRILSIFKAYQRIYDIVVNKLDLSRHEAATYLSQDKGAIQFYLREGFCSETISNQLEMAEILLKLNRKCDYRLLSKFMWLRALVLQIFHTHFGFRVIRFVEMICMYLRARTLHFKGNLLEGPL